MKVTLLITGLLIASHLALAGEPNHGDAETFYRIGNAKKHEQRYLEARQYYERSLSFDPCYQPALIAVTGLYIEGGDLPSAIKRVEQAISCEPTDALLRETYAGILIRNSEYGRAANICKELIALNPDDPRPRSLLMDCVVRSGDQAALEALLHSLFERGEISELDRIILESRFHQLAGNPGAIRELLREGKEGGYAREQLANVRHGYDVARARQASDAGQHERALTYWKRAKAFDSADGEILRQLGLTQARLADYESAESNFRELLENPPEQAEIFAEAAFVFYANEKEAEAFSLLKLSSEIARSYGDEKALKVFNEASRRIMNTENPDELFR